MMVAPTDIKWYTNANINAPQLSNAWGALIPLLNACLVDGFGSQTVLSMAASGTTVTVNFGSNHNFLQYQVIEIAGSAQAEYNGQHRILTVPTTTSITFSLAVAPSATPATGTITCKLPSLNWESPHTGINKAAYRSKTAPSGNNKFLRVIDGQDPNYTATYAKYAKVGIVEDMSDIDTMIGVQAPYDSANPNKNWVATGSGATVVNGWAKWYWAYLNDTPSNDTLLDWNNTNDTSVPAAGNRLWRLIGNGDTFYLLISPGTSERWQIYGFGKFTPFFSSDVHNTFLAACFANIAANNNPATGARSLSNGLQSNSLSSRMIAIARPLDASATYSGGVVSVDRLTYSGRDANVAASNAIGTVQYTSLMLFDSSCYRGKFPFVRWLYQSFPLASNTPFVDGNDIFMPFNNVPVLRAGSAALGAYMVKIGSLS